MSEANQTLLIHALCVIVIGGCLALAYLTPLRSEPIVGTMLVGLATWLYGVLTGKPAPVILKRIVANMDPKRVEQIMSTRPPAPEVQP